MVGRILVIDDEADVLRMLNLLFQSRGYDVVTTEDGNAAIDLLRGKPGFDVVISDVRMLPINGLWLLSLIREECPDIPVIMVTAYHSPEKAAEAIQMGAFDYIAKPFDTEKLIHVVERALAAQRRTESSTAF